MRLYALRGATTVDKNDPQAILGATEWLIREIMRRNALVPADVVSCIFTMTEDLDAEFPAVAARNVGFDQVPLMCAREIPVPTTVAPRCIRVLMLINTEKSASQIAHVYLREAVALRPSRADIRSFSTAFSISARSSCQAYTA